MKEPDGDDRTPIQIDIYGVRLKVQPQPYAEPDPESWKDVGRRVNRELMVTVAGIVRLLSTTVKAATSVIRGLGDLGRLPGVIEKRIQNAHEVVDEGEAKRAAVLTPESRTAAKETIRRILTKKVTEGLVAGANTDGEIWILLVLPPMEDEKLESLANHAMALARQIDGLVDLPVIESSRSVTSASARMRKPAQQTSRPTARASSATDDAEIADSIEEINDKLRRDGG